MSNLGRVGLVAAVVLGAAVGWLGCSSGSSATTSTPTKDASTRQCAPGALQCTSASVQAVCQDDGSGWVSAACAAGDVCSSGVCKSQSSGTACTPNTKTCASTSVARVCPSDGSGWRSGRHTPGPRAGRSPS